MRSRAATALAVCLLAVLPTAGCYQGFENTVNAQGPTGNGTDLRIGDTLLVQNATLVTGPLGESGVASLSMTIINNGDLPDALVSVSVDPAGTSSQKTPIVVTPRDSVQIGGSATDQIIVSGLNVPPGSYATVTFSFERDGSGTSQVAVVPAVGYYEGYGPLSAVPE